MFGDNLFLQSRVMRCDCDKFIYNQWRHILRESAMTQFNPPTFGQPIKPVVPHRTSPLAITGLILGIFGFCTGGLLGLVGLILGIVAIVSINKSQGLIGGSGSQSPRSWFLHSAL
jgi:hypothetical protein